jgi:putative MFS transporter
MIDMGLFVVASAMQFFVGSFEMLFVVRLLMGIAIGAEYSVGWPLLSEFAPARLRGRLMGVTILAWYAGFMIGWTTGYVLNLPEPLPWRIIIGTSTFIAIILFIARLGLPESPRWLWSKGRKDEARAIAHKYLLHHEEMEDVEHEHVHKTQFSELFEPKYIRSTVFVSWFWFCNVLPYFAIATFADEVLEQYGLGGGLAGGIGLSVVATIGVAVTVALIDKAGRRVFTVPPQWITTVIFLVIGLWSGAPPAVVLGLFLIFSFLNAMNGTLTSIYPAEVFPTEVRGRHRFRRRRQPGRGRIGHLPAADQHGEIRCLDDHAGDRGHRLQRCRGVTAVGAGDQGQEPQRDRRRVFALARRRLTPSKNTEPGGMAAGQRRHCGHSTQ